MDWALRRSRNCASIHPRCGSQTESVGFFAGSRAGGQGDISVTAPVSTGLVSGGLESLALRRMWLRIVLRSTPVVRAISCRLTPLFSNVSIVVRKSSFNMKHLDGWVSVHSPTAAPLPLQSIEHGVHRLDSRRPRGR